MIELADMQINILDDGTYEVWEYVYNNLYTFVLTSQEYHDFIF